MTQNSDAGDDVIICTEFDDDAIVSATAATYNNVNADGDRFAYGETRQDIMAAAILYNDITSGPTENNNGMLLAITRGWWMNTV